MCTFKDERTVLVCDVAIGRVRAAIDATVTARDSVRYTVVDGQGTLVEAEHGVDVQQFTVATQAAIAAAGGTVALRALSGRSVGTYLHPHEADQDQQVGQDYHDDHSWLG
jgi:hypothetical protein